MTAPDAVAVRNVGKRYPARGARSPQSVKGAVLDGFRDLRRREWHWALRDVDLRVRAGSSLGLVGHNGAGKSTLLRLIGGVGRPTTGTVTVRGRVGALLELGTGFHPELTGRESALLAMVVAGCTQTEARALLPGVASFAEVEAHLDDPLRTYSSGMAARLAFAVATATEPDVLLVDEVLAVGDLGFQRRCLARIEELRRRGATLVLVSHDPSLVAATCEEVAWLDEGRLVAHGPATAVLADHAAANEAAAAEVTPAALAVATSRQGRPLVPRENRVGTQAAQIQAVDLLDGAGRGTVQIHSGMPLSVSVQLALHAVDVAQLLVRIVRCGDRAVGVDTSTTVSAGEAAVTVAFERLDLAPGTYDVVVGLHDVRWETTYDHQEAAHELEVVGAGPRGALLAPPLRWHRTPLAARPGLSR